MIDLSTYSPTDTPATLFKYISKEGLLKIVDSDSIRATDIFYMNDAAEYNHAVNVIKEKIKGLIDPLQKRPKGIARGPGFPKEVYDIKDMEEIFLKLMQNAIGIANPWNFHIFVCSFTEENDLLSQWRGYCPKGSGYSVGFKTSSLKKVFTKKGYKLRKCIYNSELQVEIIDKLLQAGLDELPEEEIIATKLTKTITKTVQPIATKLFNDFIQIAPMFKHFSFYEEKEWRFVSPLIEFNTRDVKYWPGVSMIIPYSEINISTDSNIIPVEKVIIGPTQHPELSKKSIEGLLESKGIEDCSISLSKTPYREW